MSTVSSLALAINRVSFLSATEKIVLFERVPTELLFEQLTIDELSLICGRSIRSSNWRPSELLRAGDEDERFLAQRKIDALLYDSYPAQLREIWDAPFMLYVRGVLPTSDKPWLAVVGTRAPSRAGLSVALQCGVAIAEAGIPMVSGIARGIDAAAHAGTIRGDGKTVAIMGCGIDRIYPSSNRRLAVGILDSGGAIVSEYPPGVSARPYHFPARNRIISGLASGLVVVEAPCNSGALISAEHALSQNRDLYVHRVGLQSEKGAGARILVENGCKVIEGIQDILNDWKMVNTDFGLSYEDGLNGGDLLSLDRSSVSPTRLASDGFDPATVIGRRLEAELHLQTEGTNR